MLNASLYRWIELNAYTLHNFYPETAIFNWQDMPLFGANIWWCLDNMLNIEYNGN